MIAITNKTRFKRLLLILMKFVNNKVCSKVDERRKGILYTSENYFSSVKEL